MIIIIIVVFILFIINFYESLQYLMSTFYIEKCKLHLNFLYSLTTHH